MTSSPSSPPDEHLFPPPGERWTRFVQVLFHTFGGWAFLVGAALKAICALVRRTMGP
ncbi:MAG TPA: hypothetical protein VF332_07450 [Vicinamibacterales bacterium]